ncbi:LysR family transcriptional regulator [Taklimakanibacter lacteus]|uniref:LysR family transcriptional regulator n=1 Tax=Taklimakanibacter lacteus TaxID=2268456 RepID=UPI000E6632DF
MERPESMEIFLTVVDEGDFSAAARKLGLAPSAVSKIIARLEERLGIRLVQRSTRRIGLTAEGIAYAEAARRILADIEEAELAIRPGAEPRGLLRINLPSAFGHRILVPLLARFREGYPQIEMELSFTDAIIDLIAEGVDVAVGVTMRADSRLIMRRLAPNRRVVCAAPVYLERHGVPQSPDDLERHICLGITTRGELNTWKFEGPEGVRTLRIKSPVRADSTEALRRLALAGMGIIRISELLVGPDIRSGRLRMLLDEHNHPEGAPITIVYPSRRLLSPCVRAFVDFLIAEFAHPPWQAAS